MKKLFFLSIVFVFTANLTSAQVYMSRGEIDDITRAINDFSHFCDDYLETKERDSKKEISKGLFVLAGKMKSYNYQFTKDMQSNAPNRNNPIEKLQFTGADLSDPYNQIAAVKLSMADLAKFSQHSENLIRLKGIFKDNSYRINTADQDDINNLESFKTSVRACQEIQKTAYLQAFNERN